MAIQNMTWHRLFSRSMYKDRKLPMGEMTFFRDFIEDTTGDLYPLIRKSEGCRETVANNAYCVEDGYAVRMFAGFFPYATYEVCFAPALGSGGLVFQIPGAEASLIWADNTLTFRADGAESVHPCPQEGEKVTMIVSCRRQFFDVYFRKDDHTEFFRIFSAESFLHCDAQKSFQRGWVAVYAADGATVSAASQYIDCGVAQADLRPVCYENGDVLHENGKVYITFSIRMQENGFQGIFSWVPGTSQLELTGALFFDCGDGVWRNYLASSLLYNRKTQQWYIWVSAFENQVRLAHGVMDGDPRFGVNVADVTVMEEAVEGQGYQDFVGFRADEDPDFFYDEKENKWYMAICRIDPQIRKYRYAFFTSDQPFTGYRYIGCGYDGAETGGAFVKVDGEQLFVCGNDFKKRANYRIYSKDGMQEAKFDFDDGGFRGWGGIIPVKQGSRTRYYWITFDRHKGSDYTWSYGNLYCFEGIL